jgi:DNA excision repair protein ERCC-2
MDNKQLIKISVRNLVEFVLRAGDLDMRFTGMSRALEGTMIHQKLQKSNKKTYAEEDKEYMSEVFLSYTFQHKGFEFLIEGRADGIIVEKESINIEDDENIIVSAVVDEIKSTTRPLDIIEEDYNELHWAQAKCYAYIFALQKRLFHISVQLTYFQVDTEEIKYLVKEFKTGELSEYFHDLVDKYIIWAELTEKWTKKRDKSIKTTTFPFESYRKGQRELAVAVYRTITEEKKIFAQAPTGIGKTISTIFPAVKAMAEGRTSKIFYLTAKTITRQVAEEAFIRMRQRGLQFKTITLTAKDKICFNKGVGCNPEACEFAKGHFDRVNLAIMDILQNENELPRDKVEAYARKYNICPFEFSLDLTLWVDCVICDYNYVFDPRVYLKRFFLDNGGDYTFLIDEAHNLVDRAREMFSAELSKKTFLELKKVMKDKQPKISKALGKLNSYMIEMKALCGDNKSYVQKSEPEGIYPLLKKFVKESEEWLTKNEKSEGHEELLELYFDALAFIRISELYDERYITYVENDGEVRIKLFCLDPSYLLGEAVKRGKTAIFFSATLSPISYFKEILGGNEEDYTLRLSSPFDRDNLCLMIGDRISTKYKDREKSYGEIVHYIKSVVDKRAGNYLIFFPSYKYMTEVYNRFLERYPEVEVLLQGTSMTEEEREEFLDKFTPESTSTLIGFAVLGGIFSEGIDLRGDRLVGAVIVGVGLPQICLERDIIREYFQKKNGLGYEYSYMYPGMNKVLQAAGRVIRSETDRGVVLLLDERFTSSVYQNIFPKEWFPNIKVRNTDEAAVELEVFWGEQGEDIL